MCPFTLLSILPTHPLHTSLHTYLLYYTMNAYNLLSSFPSSESSSATGRQFHTPTLPVHVEAADIFSTGSSLKRVRTVNGKASEEMLERWLFYTIHSTATVLPTSSGSGRSTKRYSKFEPTFQKVTVYLTRMRDILDGGQHKEIMPCTSVFPRKNSRWTRQSIFHVSPVRPDATSKKMGDSVSSRIAPPSFLRNF